MFAVIRTGGKQYKVTPGQVITIEKITSEGPVDFTDVLLVGGEKTTVGQPLVADGVVKAEVVRQLRGEKIKVFKYKAKSHWSKTKGHRQSLTQVRIKDISMIDKPSKKETKQKEEEAPAS
jgi:large subunit ribosomal protein L21